MRRWILVLALLLTSVPALADGIAALRDGNAAYRAGELEDAVDAFTRAIADPALAPEQGLFPHLGAFHFRHLQNDRRGVPRDGESDAEDAERLAIPPP
jgi:hypothetical protein